MGLGADALSMFPRRCLQVVPYEPVPCKSCGAILNPYASVDYYAKIWVCPMCFARCHFPPHYQGISEQNVPAELYPQYTTIEYTLNRTVPPHPPTYLFVVDTCVAEDELHALKTAVTQVSRQRVSSLLASVHHYSVGVSAECILCRCACCLQHSQVASASDLQCLQQHCPQYCISIAAVFALCCSVQPLLHCLCEWVEVGMETLP